jgi:hypothetical protein
MLMLATKRSAKFYFNGTFLYIRNKSFSQLWQHNFQDVDSINGCRDAHIFATLITKLSMLTDVLNKIN